MSDRITGLDGAPIPSGEIQESRLDNQAALVTGVGLERRNAEGVVRRPLVTKQGEEDAHAHRLRMESDDVITIRTVHSPQSADLHVKEPHDKFKRRGF